MPQLLDDIGCQNAILGDIVRVSCEMEVVGPLAQNGGDPQRIDRIVLCLSVLSALVI